MNGLERLRNHILEDHRIEIYAQLGDLILVHNALHGQPGELYHSHPARYWWIDNNPNVEDLPTE